MSYVNGISRQRTFWLAGIVLLAMLLASCGGASAPQATSSTFPRNGGSTNTNPGATSNQPKATGTGGQKTSPTSFGPQYIVKTLKVGMAVKDTRKAANDIQSWITAADPQAISTGINYETVSDNLFNISISFSVRATLYPQIASYLNDYPSKQQGRLTDFNESVQDVTNDYIDTQSRLKNLRAEQERLLELVSHAQALSDVMALDQRLTDVEGQIESTEAHLKALSSQVAFYTVSINLQPIDTAPPPPSSDWSAPQIFHDAITASLAFGRGLLAFFIWLLAFSIYVIPAILIIWLLVWRMNRPHRTTSLPKPNPAASVYTPIPPETRV